MNIFVILQRHCLASLLLESLAILELPTFTRGAHWLDITNDFIDHLLLRAFEAKTKS